MKIKKTLFFMILFMISLLCVKDKYALGEEDSTIGGVSLSPAYMDLGSLTEDTKSFTITVMNEGKEVHLKARIDNAENVKITASPNKFTLAEHERKDITVTIKNDDTLKIGVYDLSIALLSESGGEQSISAYGSNSLRLVFRKSGLALATCNVKDIPPIQEAPFYSILSNFYNKTKTVNVSIKISSKTSGNIVWEQSDKLKMKPYPNTGFYGEIDTPAPTQPWEYGNYIYKLSAKIKDDIVLEYQTEFNVGEMKGNLESVSTKNVKKGDLARFKAVIRNIGTQKLPTTVKIVVKDHKNNLIYNNTKSEILITKEVKEFLFEWPTKHSKVGKYSLEYNVTMGDQQETGTLNYEVNYSCQIWWFVIGCMILITIVLLILVLKSPHRKSDL